MLACVDERVFMDSSLKSKVALFDQAVNKHKQGQAVNPFSNDKKCGSLPKPTISKEDYGRPPRGSLSEMRALKATVNVCREVLQLCEVISQAAEPLYPERPEDPRVAISFGELFAIYTSISNKVVGILLRARKYKLLDFEGECLFQRRDDDVPIILLKPIEEIRRELTEKIEVAVTALGEEEELI